MTRWALFAAVLFLAHPVQAQQLSLEIRDGRVTLDAANVTVRQILAEWALVGDTTIVNGERVAGAPVTLTLVDMPEKQALEIVLRNVAGYMAAARADLSAGVSHFDRIMVLPTSTAPAVATVTPGQTARPAFGPGNPAQGDPRIIRGPIGQVSVEEGEAYVESDVEMPEVPENSNIFVPSAPNPMPFGQPGQPFRFPTGGSNAPIIMRTPDGQTIPPDTLDPPSPAVGSSVPGVVTPPTRPPG